MRKALLLALSLLALPAYASFTAVTAPASFYNSPSGGDGAGRSFIGNVTSVQAGDLVVIQLAYGGPTTTVSVSDGSASIWGQTAETCDATQCVTWVYTLSSVATGSPTYVVTFGSARQERRYQFWHYRPSAAASYGSFVGASGTGTSAGSGNLTVSGSDILAFGSVQTWNTNTSSASAHSINGSAATVIVTPTTHYDLSWVRAFGSGYTGAATATIGSDIWVASQIYFTIGGAPPASTLMIKRRRH